MTISRVHREKQWYICYPTYNTTDSPVMKFTSEKRITANKSRLMESTFIHQNPRCAWCADVWGKYCHYICKNGRTKCYQTRAFSVIYGWTRWRLARHDSMYVTSSLVIEDYPQVYASIYTYRYIYIYIHIYGLAIYLPLPVQGSTVV